MRLIHVASLTAPMDDMWATFADMAEQFLLEVDGVAVGFCSVNEERELNRFFVGREYEELAPVWFMQAIEEKSICAALPATLDHMFLSLSLDIAENVEVKALLFEGGGKSQMPSAPLNQMRLAVADDLPAVVEFQKQALGAPEEFLNAYSGARITARELLLHEINGSIVSSGEIRPDKDNPTFAHVGLIVAEGQRGKGVGGAVIYYLVEECKRQGLQPICSTEPSNQPARKIIENAGFRARNRLLRIGF